MVEKQENKTPREDQVSEEQKKKQTTDSKQEEHVEEKKEESNQSVEDKKSGNTDNTANNKQESMNTETTTDVLVENKQPEKQREEFNWEEYDDDKEYSDEEWTKYEQMYNNTLSTVTENEVVDGTVISMNKREVVINIGYKSEGVVSLNEFRYNPDLKVGDTVEVYIENQEDKKGQLILSHKKARTLRSWERVNRAHEKEEVIQGYIKCRTKGGMIVDVFGIEAFLPGSQIDVKPIRDYDLYVDKTMDFKVVKVNHEFKNVVVSHKALIEAELEQQKKEIIAKLEKGQVLEGTVKNITSYGVFIDLGGVDGLIHITDLSWGRINHPEEIVQLDQKLNVVILDFDEDKSRIALGLKQLTEHPWDKLDQNLKVGDVVKGKVVVMADYGAFVEIAPGVEGLVHVSEMSWSQHLRSAQDFLKIGDEVETKVLTLDREERKMSLGIKQLKPDPWEEVENKYPVGSKHTAKVRNFTNFGIFVEIEEGVDGLVHISDLSWTKKINHPAEFTSIGEEIEVVVLEIDKENRRLSLGHKQLEENPWDVFENVFEVGTIHEGTITDIFDKGAKIALPYGVEGFATPKHLVKEDGSKVTADEKLPFKVIEFSKEQKRIILSHSRVFEDEKKTPKSETKKPQSSEKKGKQPKGGGYEKTTLGDITALSSLKSEMEGSQKKEAAAAQKKKQDEAAKKKEKEEVVDKKEAKAAEKKAEEKKEKASESKADVKEEKKETKAKKEPAKAEEKKETKQKKTETKPKAKTAAKTAAKKSTTKAKTETKKASSEKKDDSKEKKDDK